MVSSTGFDGANWTVVAGMTDDVVGVALTLAVALARVLDVSFVR
jgi:hypothetical protein